MNDGAVLTPVRHPWLERLAADPERAVDSLLRGVAHLPGWQRASPTEALMALLGDLAPEWSLLDGAVLGWLQIRRAASDELLIRPGGVQRFIRETGEGLRVAWRLNSEDGCTLPRSTAWLREQMVDLLHWADGFTRDPVFDLGRVLLTAAAHLQQGKELRFLWLRLGDDAATPRLRHRLDAALLGLATMPGGLAGGPSHDVIVGLARWADLTGEAYCFVTSCSNIASVVMDRSPGQALTLARRAVLWDRRIPCVERTSDGAGSFGPSRAGRSGLVGSAAPRSVQSGPPCRAGEDLDRP